MTDGKNSDGRTDDVGLDDEDRTAVERAIERTPSQLELARADGAAFDAVASGLDAFRAALGSMPASLGRLSRPRRRSFLRAVILKLDEVSLFLHEVRHEMNEMHRLEEARKDEHP